jgi:hypothetical protein
VGNLGGVGGILGRIYGFRGGEGWKGAGMAVKGGGGIVSRSVVFRD